MKNIYKLFTVMIALVLCASCNDDWKDEQFKQVVSFKANIDSKGVTPIYIRYKPEGKVTYNLPMIASGSIMNGRDITVHVGVDHDTLKVLNQERFSTRSELFYKELGSQHFEIPETADIIAGTSQGVFPIDLSLKDLDLVEKWILPLSIENDPLNVYQVNDRKHYRKALMRVFPFNNYSGDYSATAYKVYFRGQENEAIVTNTVTSYVVDENTIFFYAGLVNEDRQDRKHYKIFAQFNDDKTLTITTDNPTIDLQVSGRPSYLIEEEMDAIRPYLKNVFVTITLEYSYKDYTSVPGQIIDYIAKGTLIMQRKINTQIPDEDQAIEW